jgi:Ion channel
MLANLSMSLLMTLVVVIVHLTGLLLLLRFLRRNAHRAFKYDGLRNLLRQGGMMLLVALGIFLLHAIEIWLYALAYLALGAFKDFPTALYFSASAFSTLGIGDVVPDARWRLFGAIEGVTGLILIGWSSAFLLSVTSRLRALEHDWENYAAKPAKRQNKPRKS